MFIGALLGVFDATALRTSSQIGPEEPWYCPVSEIGVGNTTCRARGCKKSSPHPDSYWVCDYVSYGGASCPPLESCELGGGN